MQTITDAIYFHPLAVELPIDLALFAVSLFLALEAGKKLFASLAVKNRTASLIGAFAWYIVLYIYFSGVFSVLSHSVLMNLGVSRNDIDRLYYATENYFLPLSLVFLVCGAIALFVFTKKQTILPVAQSGVSFVRLLWVGARKAILIVFLASAAVVISGMPAVNDKKLTEETIQKIDSQKITLADVMGKNLPPQLDQALNDSTLVGIDVNNNGIRDDVEFAIFKLHPDSARIRAAELQYAMALQNEFTNVFNSETLVATIQQEGRAYLCIGNDGGISEVENLVFNNDQRKNIREEIRKKYMTSFSLSIEPACDIQNL